MTCEQCGMPAQGRLCADCETIQRCETKHGDSVDSDSQWRVEQTGLGDKEVEGQATLDGGIARDGGADE